MNTDKWDRARRSSLLEGSWVPLRFLCTDKNGYQYSWFSGWWLKICLNDRSINIFCSILNMPDDRPQLWNRNWQQAFFAGVRFCLQPALSFADWGLFAFSPFDSRFWSGVEDTFTDSSYQARCNGLPPPPPPPTNCGVKRSILFIDFWEKPFTPKPWIWPYFSSLFCTQVHCEMSAGGGWMRVADIHPAKAGSCPGSFGYITNPKRLCVRTVNAGCNSAFFSTYGVPFSQVRGYVYGYQVSL